MTSLIILGIYLIFDHIFLFFYKGQKNNKKEREGMFAVDQRQRQPKSGWMIVYIGRNK